jgi:hypothetical protein
MTAALASTRRPTVADEWRAHGCPLWRLRLAGLRMLHRGRPFLCGGAAVDPDGTLWIYVVPRILGGTTTLHADQVELLEPWTQPPPSRRRFARSPVAELRRHGLRVWAP